MPLGDHEADKLPNAGGNGWIFRPEIGVSKALGPTVLELIGSASIFGDNEEFLGRRVREQDPVYSLQARLLYSFSSGAWVALDATPYRGGRATVDGMRNHDLQENTRLDVTLALPLSRRHSLKFSANTGVSTRAGGDFESVALAWQYRWGGGI